MLRTATVLICAALLSAPAPAASAEAAASWSVSPTEYAFAPRLIGTGPSAPAVFTLTNTGTSTLSPPQFAASFFVSGGELVDRFALTSQCEGGLAAGASCPIEVTFEPTGAGQDTESLTLYEPEGHVGALQIRLTGAAAVPAIKFTSAGDSLPSRPLGIEINPPSVLTVTNTGEADLHISNLRLVELGTNPVNPDGLRIVGGSCGPGATVAVGASCTVWLTAAPTVPGTVTAGLEFTDDVPERTSLEGHQILPLRVTGFVWSEPLIAAAVAITSGPPAKLYRTWARFRFVVADARPSFLCRLDSQPYRPCTSPTTYRHLARGRHVFRVRPATSSPTVSADAAVERFRVLPAARHR